MDLEGFQPGAILSARSWFYIPLGAESRRWADAALRIQAGTSEVLGGLSNIHGARV